MEEDIRKALKEGDYVSLFNLLSTLLPPIDVSMNWKIARGLDEALVQIYQDLARFGHLDASFKMNGYDETLMEVYLMLGSQSKSIKKFIRSVEHDPVRLELVKSIRSIEEFEQIYPYEIFDGVYVSLYESEIASITIQISESTSVAPIDVSLDIYQVIQKSMDWLENKTFNQVP